MNLIKRNQDIKTDYSTGLFTYEQLAEKYNRSIERIRQIINPAQTNYCKEHKYTYLQGKNCILHDIDTMYDGELSMSDLMEKLHRLSVADRKKETVYERKIITKILKNKFSLSSHFIAKLLNQDPTTIKHHLGER
jgi:hypothetical protein